MDPEIKAKWLAALRSGNYTQGRLRLRNRNNEMCCLGVLCEILDPSGWGAEIGGPTHHECASEPAPGLCVKSGLSEANLGDLITMNDGDRRSFAEIADWIEARL